MLDDRTVGLSEMERQVDINWMDLNWLGTALWCLPERGGEAHQPANRGSGPSESFEPRFEEARGHHLKRLVRPLCGERTQSVQIREFLGSEVLLRSAPGSPSPQPGAGSYPLAGLAAQVTG